MLGTRQPSKGPAGSRKDPKQKRQYIQVSRGGSGVPSLRDSEWRVWGGEKMKRAAVRERGRNPVRPSGPEQGAPISGVMKSQRRVFRNIPLADLGEQEGRPGDQAEVSQVSR